MKLSQQTSIIIFQGTTDSIFGIYLGYRLATCMIYQATDPILGIAPPATLSVYPLNRANHFNQRRNKKWEGISNYHSIIDFIVTPFSFNPNTCHNI